jgi:hypothetical protein
MLVRWFAAKLEKTLITRMPALQETKIHLKTGGGTTCLPFCFDFETGSNM